MIIAIYFEIWFWFLLSLKIQLYTCTQNWKGSREQVCTLRKIYTKKKKQISLILINRKFTYNYEMFFFIKK